MKRYKPIEICGFVCGIACALIGIGAIIWPQAGVIPHFTNNDLGLSAHSELQVVSPTGARFHGVLEMIFGFGITGWSLYYGKSK